MYMPAAWCGSDLDVQLNGAPHCEVRNQPAILAKPCIVALAVACAALLWHRLTQALTQRCLASLLNPWQVFEPRPISQLHEVRAAWARLQHLQALPEGAQERAALPDAAAALLSWLRLQATAVALLMAVAGKAVLAGCTTACMLLSLTGRSAGAAAAGSSGAASAANAAEQLVVSLMAPEDVAEAGAPWRRQSCSAARRLRWCTC